MSMDHTNDSDMSIETNSQALRRGSALARALEERAAELKISQKEVANILQISYPYYALLLSGERWFGAAAKEKLVNIGKFLNIPTASVFVLAEILTINDWFDATNTLQDQIELAFKTFQRDKRYTMCLPTEAVWAKTPLEAKLTIILLYQEVSNKHLISSFTLAEIVDPKETQESEDNHPGSSN
jgi:transcriptional regulator with XRE-family HTH domain